MPGNGFTAPHHGKGPARPEVPDYLQRLTRQQANELIHWVFDGHLPQRDASLEVIAAVFYAIGAMVMSGFALARFHDDARIVVFMLAAIAGVFAYLSSGHLVAAFGTRRDKRVMEIAEDFFAPERSS